ncbi:MAG: ribonuclease Z [Deltaproteobacteria bacterium]|nr:ribonuclease Z [Deltaproteobacteria bacterium]MBW2340995.1 ribonuclease Z [Deltaproteobacteria bacterium]
MRPSFHPRLVNDPFSDPGLFIPFLFERRALLFDLGDLSNLSARDLLKVSHVFVTHTHMDHFIGFDILLRLLLGRDKEIYLFGPSPFFQKVEAKLSAYTWNLIENYENILSINVTEITKAKCFMQRYESRNRFRHAEAAQEFTFDGNLLSEPSFSVDAALFDHKVECLGLSLRENFSINIIKEGLRELELPVGPWLAEFKRAIYEGCDPDQEFQVFWQDKDKKTGERYFALGELKEKIARISPGQKITYITDIIGSPENIAKAVNLSMDSNHLFIEAPFLDNESDMARKKYHLTAKEAGLIAARARVKELTLFHFSPRYFNREKELFQEAMAAFRAGA